MSAKYLTTPPLTTEVPKGIPYIIGNEAAERFSFYGMKGILVVFMTQFLFLMPGAAGGDPMPRANTAVVQAGNHAGDRFDDPVLVGQI